MITRLSRLVTGLAGTILTIVLLVGPPWLLTTRVGSPIPTSWPDLDMLRTLTSVGVTDTFVVTALAVVVWFAWVQFALAIVVELVSAIRRRPAVRLPLLPGAQPAAARLVAATLLLVTALQPRAQATAEPLDLAVVVTAPAIIADHEPAADHPQPTSTPSPITTRNITVGERDSWWSLAETHLGDGMRWRELRELNTTRLQPDGATIGLNTDQLQPGWTLLVPAAADDGLPQPTHDRSYLEAQRGPQVESSNGPHSAEVDHAQEDPSPDLRHRDAAVDAEWQVEVGDHLWHIASSTLQQAWDREPTDAEILPYWRELIEGNRDRLARPADPDLIHPGQRFALPSIPTDPALAAGGPNPHVEIETSEDGSVVDPLVANADVVNDEGDVPMAGVGDPTGDSSATTGDSSATSEDNPHPEVEIAPLEVEDVQTATQPEWPDESAASEPPAATDPDRSGHSTVGGWEHRLAVGGEDGSTTDGPEEAPNGHTFELWSSLGAGVAAAGLSAAGITALIRRRRRLALQQRPSGRRLPTPAPDTVDHLHRLEIAAPNDDQGLADLAALFATIPTTAQPAIVTIDDDGGVRLLFSDDVAPGAPVEPWQALPADDGEPAGWIAQAGAGGPRRSVGLPLLLTLGRTGNRTILVNLASIRPLSFCGERDAVTLALHAACLEVATSRTAGPLEVAVAGAATHPALEQASSVEDLSHPLDVARRERDQGVVDDDRTVMMLVAHPGIEVPDGIETLTDPFVGLVCGTDHPPNAGWAIHLHDDGQATLHLPDGGLVDLQRPDIDPTLIHDELDRHEQTVEDPHAITDIDAEPPPETAPASEADQNGPSSSGSERGTAADLPAPRSSAAASTDDPGLAPDSDPVAEPGVGIPTELASTNGHLSRQVSSEPTTLEQSTLEVRVLGPVAAYLHGQPLTGLAPLTLQILVYLATHPEGVSSERLEDVIWNGQAASPRSQRLRSALTKLRDALGPGPDGQPLLPRRRGRTDPIRLAGRVTTDLEVAVGHLEHARTVQGSDRLALLDKALAQVRGEPFAGWPLSWASEIAERAIAQLQDAAAAAAAGHRRREAYEHAEQAILTGLKLCDPNDTLYIEWARLEAARGRHDQIPRVWQRLKTAYDTHADDTTGFVGTPTAATTKAFEQLLASATPLRAHRDDESTLPSR